MSEERVVRRGEVWWVKSLDSFGHEYSAGRPCVIVSNDKGNENNPTVIGVYLTTQNKSLLPVNVRVNVDGKKQVAMCNQIITADKNRLDWRICTLTESEMIRIDGALVIALGITMPEQKQEEPADVVALRCERDMWKGMYDKVLEMLVDQRMKETVAQISVVQKTVTEVIEKPKPPVEKREKPLLVDINHCSELALRELGLSDADAGSVISCRPFESVLELNCVPDLDTGWVAANEHRFVCTPIVVEETPKETGKVNINTCRAKDLVSLGMDKNRVYKITSDRKKNGAFLTVGDLTRVAGIGQKWLDTWIDKLEV